MPASPVMRHAFIILLHLLYWFCIGVAQANPADNSAANGVSQSGQPQSNSEIRQWYNDQVASIEGEDQKWQQAGLSAEQRARRAYQIRRAARLKAREFMQDKQEVALLQARDQDKYGHPDGPSFDYLVEQNRKKGLSGDAAYLAIIGSASNTNPDANKAFNRPASPRQSAP